jgi:hypothetical protein
MALDEADDELDLLHNRLTEEIDQDEMSTAVAASDPSGPFLRASWRQCRQPRPPNRHIARGTAEG